MTGPLTDLGPWIADISCRVLGEPNRLLSTRQQLRFGSNGSVAVEIDGAKRGQWFDHEAGVGGGPWELLTIKGRMTNGAAGKWLQSELGIEIKPAAHTSRHMVATYDYRDESGNLLSQVCRFEPKDFQQRRPDGKGGWICPGDARRDAFLDQRAFELCEHAEHPAERFTSRRNRALITNKLRL
jgi:putative DNA primase/helicase